MSCIVVAATRHSFHHGGLSSHLLKIFFCYSNYLGATVDRKSDPDSMKPMEIVFGA